MVTEVHVKKGQIIQIGKKVLSIETTKSEIEIYSDRKGRVLSIPELGTQFEVGQEILSLEVDDTNDPQATEKHPRRINMTLKAQKIASQNNISSSLLEEDKLYKEADLKAIVEKQIKLEKFSFRKITENENLKKAVSNQFGSQVSIPISNEKTIKALKNYAPKDSLSPTIAISFFAAQLMGNYPHLNAFYSERGIKCYRNIKVGLTMNDSEIGLKIVGIPVTQELGILGFEKLVQEAELRYFRNELTQEDVSGATFCVSSFYDYGVTDFQPLIFTNNSFILGICAPGSSGEFKIIGRFDHRITDGLEVSNFLVKLKSIIEESH